MEVNRGEADRPHRGPQLAVHVYMNSGWSAMTAAHKNVSEEIRDEGDVRRDTRRGSL